MYRCEVGRVPPGAILGASVFNEGGPPLVKAGVALTDAYLRQVAARGYTRLVLLEPEERVQPETIPPETRATILAALTEAVSFLLEVWRCRRSPQPGEGRRFDFQLRDAVDAFIREATDQAAITLPGSVRRGPAQRFDDAINAGTAAVYLGKEAQMDDASLHRLAWGILLRDVAQLLLSPDVLEHPGGLSNEQWQLVREHPAKAYDLLRSLDWGEETGRLVVLQHHERADGSGYPFALTGLHTVQRSRRDALDAHLTCSISDVAAVADIFNALTVDRPYRSARPAAEVTAILREAAGVSLNHEVVELLLSRGQPPHEGLPASIAAAG